MKKSLLSAAFACAALAMPGLAMADDAMSSKMGHDAMAPAKMATMMCRPAAEGEKPSAVMTGASKTALVCKPVAMEKMMKKGAGPDLSHALSTDQVDAAWRTFIQQAVTIPGGTGGG
jgi:hypothetical protein